MNLIEQAEELLSKATPGPWHYNGNEVVANAKPRVGIAGAMSEEDCELIAESPTLLQGLIDLVKQQQEELQQAKKALEWYADSDTHEVKRRIGGDFAPIILDHGNRARKALSTMNGGEPSEY